MTLHLHDTAARAVREFTPITPGQVSVYLCGATVQAPPHIGHLRSAVAFDVLVRWLEASGYRVTFCRNVTDIEDKILRTAQAEGVPPWIVAERNQRAFTWAYDAVGCRPPDIEPRATGHIPEMIVLIRRLIEGGHAYPGGGDVYFDVHSYPGYGALSGQRLDQMRPAEDADDVAAKRDPRDFTLWKGAKPGEPFWETPWGPGPPRLAPGVLGHVHQVPRAHLRHPRRRDGPDLPAPRERDRAVPRGRRRLRPVLDAQRAARAGRGEDEQVPAATRCWSPTC